LARLLGVAPGSFVVVDRDGVILDASRWLLSELDRPREAVIGAPFASLLHPLDPGGPLEESGGERCLAHASGGERWFAARARAADGVTYGVLTPRESPAATGLSPGQQLAGVLEHAPIIVFAVDREGVFTLSRGHGLRALGLAPDQITGKSLFDLYAEEPAVIAHVRRALAGDTFAAEVESQGRRFETHFAPLRDGQGEIAGAMGVAIDITDHHPRGGAIPAAHRAHAGRRRGRSRRTDRVRESHARGRSRASQRRRRARKAAHTDLLADDDTSTLARVAAAAVSQERLPPEEGRFRGKGGATLIAEVALMPLGEIGAPATLLVARNVSERKAMQARLILAERLVSLGTLAAGVAHEINNPLTYVSLNLGFMTRELAALARELGTARRTKCRARSTSTSSSSARASSAPPKRSA